MSDSRPYVLVLYYSRFGATRSLAEQLVAGIESQAGIDARLRVAPAAIDQPAHDARTQRAIDEDPVGFLTADGRQVFGWRIAVGTGEHEP